MFFAEILIQLLQLKFPGVNHPEKLISPFPGLPQMQMEGTLWPDCGLIYVILKSDAAQSAQKPTHLVWLGRSIALAWVAVGKLKLVICRELI